MSGGLFKQVVHGPDVANSKAILHHQQVNITYTPIRRLVRRRLKHLYQWQCYLTQCIIGYTRFIDLCQVNQNSFDQCDYYDSFSGNAEAGNLMPPILQLLYQRRTRCVQATRCTHLYQDIHDRQQISVTVLESNSQY